MSSACTDAILVLNSGSSSLKAGLFSSSSEKERSRNFAGETVVLSAQASGIGQGGGHLSIRDAAGNELSHDEHAFESQGEALDAVAKAVGKYCGGAMPAAIGHRIVHGGPKLLKHVRIDKQVVETLKSAIHFAPLHLPSALALIDQAQRLFPGVPQAACFDTVFHSAMPPVARRLPIPTEFSRQGLQRYGFHGLSYESLVGQLRQESPLLPERIVMAHLGSGSSLCAVRKGESVDTTMGLTPTGGIPMATRTGDLDPGVLLFLARNAGLDVDALETLVNHKSGIAAVSGSSGDMQALQEAMEASPDATNPAAARRKADATLAFEMFATSIAKAIVSLTVSLTGLDLLVFTGGIGEHSAALRAAVLDLLAPFGIRLDKAANARHASQIALATSKVPVRLLPAEEDPVIAAHARRLLALSS